MMHKKTNLFKINKAQSKPLETSAEKVQVKKRSRYKSMTQTLTTFDGLEKNCISEGIVSPLVAQDIERICLNIVRHIQEVSGGNTQVYQMKLYFKVDIENRVWFQFCTGIKTRNKWRMSDSRDVDYQEQKKECKRPL